MLLIHYTQAQLSLTNGSPSSTIDFSSTISGVNNGAYTGAGFQSTPTTGQLNSNAWAATGWSDGSLAFGGTQTTATTDYTRGATSAAVTTGGFYAGTMSPHSASNPALLIQPGGSDFAPGTLTLKIKNNGTSNITSLDVSYKIYVRNDQGRGSSFNFSHSSDNSSYTAVAALDYTTTAAADASPTYALVGTKSTTITGLNIAPSAVYYIRWSSADVSGSGSRDEIGLDDIYVNATFATTTPASDVTVGAGTEPATLSSLINTQAASSLNFDFTVNDDAQGDDPNPTLIRQITVAQGTGNDIADWTQAIAGAELTDGTNSITAAVGSTTLSFGIIPSGSGQLGEVLDGTSKTYTLKVWLKTSIGGTLPTTVDGLNLAFKVDRSNFITTGTTTAFASGAGTAVESGSSNNAIVVVATALNYTTAFSPTTIDPNTNFTTAGVVRAQDANGNTDKDVTSTVTITNSGSLGMANANGSFAAGVFTFPSNFQFTNGGATVTVTVDDGNAGTTNATSGNIIVNNPPVSDVTSAAGGEALSVSSIANTSGAAISVFNFTVTDDVSGNDALATLISNLVISQGTGNDVATWTNVIAGATLSDGTNTLAGTVNGTNITFASIPNGAGQLGYVADGSSKTYTLNLWINVVIGGGLANTVDGMNLAFKVDRSSFTASVSGTPFAPGAGTAVESGATNNAVDVTATALNFTTAFAPTTINVFANFATPGVVKAQDANGNLDLNYTNSVSVSNSAGYTMGNVPGAFVAGVLTFPANFQFATGGSTTTVTVDDANAGTTNATSGTLTINVPVPTLATSIAISNFLCPGSTVSVPYTANNFNSGNVFTAQLSDASGSFSSPTSIGTVTATASGTISATIPTSTANGSGYRIRVVGSNPPFNGTDNGLNITIQYSTVNVLFTESMGAVSTNPTAIATQESGNGFDNTAFTMSGTAELRNTVSSSGSYAGASGGANMYFGSSGTTFIITGINTSGLSPMMLSFGLFKTSTSDNGSNFLVDISTDGGANWTNLPWITQFGALPTGTGTATNYYLVKMVGSIPQSTTFALRFKNIGASVVYRLDDVTLSYGVATSPAISPTGPITQCGGTVSLTATPANSTYAWSNSANTQVASIGATGSYTVNITDGLGCTASRGPVSVTINTPVTPSIIITSANNPVCAGTTQTFTVGSTTNGGTPTYQWKLNGSNVGTGTTTYSTNSLNANDVVTCEMTTSLSCVTNATVSSNAFVARGAVNGTTQVWTEGFGAATVSDINNYTSGTNASLAFSGLGDIKTTTASTGYTGASGGGNMYMAQASASPSGEKYVLISNINTTNAYPNKLFFAFNKNTNADNGNDLVVEYSLDGVSYFNLGLITVPTGAGTAGSFWHQVTFDNALPYGTNVRLRFRNTTPTTVVYRLDDVTLIKYNPVNATISAGGPTAICPGGSVTLTAAPSGMSGYSWSNGGSSISTTVNTANTYTVSVSDGTCSSKASQVVSINAVPVVSPSASPATICNGASTTLNANATAGSGTITTYAWSAGIAGNNASGTVSPSGNTTYTVTVTNSNTCTASASVGVTVNACGTNTWLGNTTDWHTATNWSNGYVPNSCAHDVLIPSVANSPVISSPVSVGNIELQSNALLTLNAGVSVCGDYVGGSGNVSKVLGSGTFTLSGSGSQALSGKTLFNTLRLNNSTGAVLQSGAQFDVFTAVELQSGTLNTIAGTLRFRSTSSTDYAVLDNFSAGFTGTINGNVTAERYYDAAGSGAKNQHLMGSPIAATPLSAFGASGTPGYIIPTGTCDEINSASNSPWGTVFSYDESHGATCAQAGWKVETGGTATATKGFSIYKTGAGVITVNGAPNLAGSYQATSLTNTGGWQNFTQQGRSVDAGWHIVANPYLSDLDISSTPSGFDPLKMVWNTTGAFAGSYQPATVVGPFQAFMVRKSVPGSAAYTINASQRTRSGSPVFQKQANDHELTITATNTGTNLMDVTTVAFNADASAAFDAGYDAVKSAGSLTRHTLYTTMNGSPSWLCLNVVKDIETTNSIPLNMEPGVNGTYSLSFNGVSSFDPTSYITLEDKQLNVFHDVRSGAYSFTANANDNWNRFVLHFTPAAKFSSSNATCQAQGQLNITQPGSANWNYTITNSANVTIASGVLNNNQPVISSVAAGVYTITLVDNNGYTVVKNIQVNGATPITAAMQASSTVAEAGEDITFTSTTANAASTTWNFGDGSAEQTATISTHQYATEGVYTVSLTATNTDGCSSTVLQSVTVTAKTTTGIETVENNGLHMWSNGDRVYVDFSSLKQVEATIDIYNILGQKLSSEKFGKSSIYSHAFTNLDAGYVLLSVKNNGEVVARKLFISTSK